MHENPTRFALHVLLEIFQVLIVIGDNFDHANAVTRFPWRTFLRWLTGQLCYLFLVLCDDDLIAGGQSMD